MDGIQVLDTPIPVIRITGRVFPSNTYLVAVGAPGSCLLVDPGLDSELIARALARHCLVPTTILCTHGHFDHLGSAAEFQHRFGVPVFLHEADLPTARSSNFLLMAMKIDRRITVPKIAHPLGNDLALMLNEVEVRYHATPGHTPGSTVITLSGVAFTGDTLYSRGIGLSGLPGENTEQLKVSVARLMGALADDVLIMPGHGGEATLGDIKRSNVALQKFLGSGVGDQGGLLDA